MSRTWKYLLGVACLWRKQVGAYAGAIAGLDVYFLAIADIVMLLTGAVCPARGVPAGTAQ